MVSKSDVHVRWMIRRDMPAVMSIENESFEFPWSEENMLGSLRHRHRIGMVAEQDEQVIGFNIYELHKNRLHLINFAVAKSHRRSGVGRAMLDHLARKLTPERRSRIMLEVRETNLEAQVFFRACGFRAVDILRGFWEDSDEDAYLMQYRVTDAVSGRDSGVGRVAVG